MYNLKTSDFDFELPEERIAQHAVEPRDSARLLRVMQNGLSDLCIRDLPDLLREGDLLVMNDTRVIPARVYGKRGDVTVEVLLHKKNTAAPIPCHSREGGNPVGFAAENVSCSPSGVSEKTAAAVSAEHQTGFRIPPQCGGSGMTLSERVSEWLVFAKPGKRLKVGQVIEFAPDFSAEVLEKHEGGEILLRFLVGDNALLEMLKRYGEPPLPPYIKRNIGAAKADVDRYQTVYAARDGAVAAPTAGLHFTPELFEKLEKKGIDRAVVTLHVGAGTFLPVKAEYLKDHVMHSEWGEVTADVANKINTAKREGRRIVCVGTTSLRVLESAADENGVVHPFAEETAIFITPGYKFRAVDALLTNFHLPQSTLFMLVSAFMGLDKMKNAYAHAIKNGYRFYSYGDACLLER